MCRRLPRFFHASLFGLILATWCFTSLVRAQSVAIEDGADAYPASTLLFLTLEKPGQIIEKLLEHPLRERIEATNDVQKQLNSAQFRQLMLGVKFVESQVGMEWLPLVNQLTDAGFYLGFDPSMGGAAALIRSSDTDQLKTTAGTLLGLAKSMAGKGNAPYTKTEYRGAKVAQFDNFLISRWNDWLIITNSKKMGRFIVDSLNDGASDRSLSRQAHYRAARRTVVNASSQRPDAWAYADLAQLRKSGQASELFRGRTDEAFLELVAGGILWALQDADYVCSSLSIDRDWRLTAHLPYSQQAEPPATRTFFFGERFTGRAPLPLKTHDTIANLVTHRDLGQWWLSKEDLFEENVIAQLAAADSQISTLFGGLDFGEEVLGNLKAGLQVVVCHQKFDQGSIPDVKIPSFALVGQLKDTGMQRRLKVAFQSVIGFANIQLGMNGQPQLDLETERFDNAVLNSAQYMMMDDTEQRGQLIFNFSPSLAFSGDYFVLSSTRQLAMDVMDSAQSASPQASSDSNTHIAVDGPSVHKILELNRDTLIAQNMLEKGQSLEQSELEIDTLLQLLALVKDVEFDFEVGDQTMAFQLEMRFTPNE